MNTSTLRSKRLWIPTAAAVAALGVGGTIWATTASADDLSGHTRDRVTAAAQDAVGSGKVISAEKSDPDRDGQDTDDRNEVYEVEIRKADGTEVDVTLDKDLKVLSQDSDARDDVDDNDDAADRSDADDRVLSASEKSSATKAATSAVDGGTVTDLSASDDRGVAYELDVRAPDGTDWDIDLDSSFAVVHKSIDR